MSAPQKLVTRKPYKSPELVVYGPVHVLTQTDTNSFGRTDNAIPDPSRKT